MVVNNSWTSKLMSIPATNAHLWPAGNLPDGSIVFPGRIFVGGLSSERNPEGSVKEEDLQEFFGTFGTVTEVKMIQHHEDGTFRGFAFVTFADQKSADKVFEQFSDSTQRSRFVIKGLDLKIGHAVRKGHGVQSAPNPALAARNMAANCNFNYLYNQQLLAQLSNSPYCNPYYIGALGDPLINGLFCQNPLYGLQSNATAPNIPLGKLPSPVTSHMSSSPVSISGQVPNFNKVYEVMTPRTATTGGNAELVMQNTPGGTSASSQPLCTSNSSVMVTSPNAAAGSTNPVQVPQPVFTSANMLHNYNLRCQNPYNYGLMPPNMSLPQHGVIPQYCNAPLVQTASPVDQAYFNNYFCYQPQPAGSFINPQLTGIASNLSGLDSPHIDAHCFGNKIGMNVFEPPPAKTMNMGASATSVHTPTCIGQLPKRELFDIPAMVSFESQIHPSMQVHFANSPLVEDLTNVSGMGALPPRGALGQQAASSKSENIHGRNFKHGIENGVALYSKASEY